LDVDFNCVLQNAVKIDNLNKSTDLNSQIFREICQDMGLEYITLLLCPEVHWLSHGSVKPNDEVREACGLK
jgi:hypothetical protein